MREDRVADGESRHRIADRCDRSRGFDSERHWRRAADPPASDPDQFVPVPDARRMNVDHDLVRRKLPRLIERQAADRTADNRDPSPMHPLVPLYDLRDSVEGGMDA